MGGYVRACVCVCVIQVVQSQLYGCTYEFVKHYLNEKLNVDVTFVDSADVTEFKAAIRPNTKVPRSTSQSHHKAMVDRVFRPRHSLHHERLV